MIVKISTSIASSSFAGSTTVASYLPVEATAMIDPMEVNSANKPNSPGEYKRVRIGEITTVIACAVAVPITKVKVFATKESDAKNLSLILDMNAVPMFDVSKSNTLIAYEWSIQYRVPFSCHTI